MKVFNLGVYELKGIGNRFAEHIFDAMIKSAPVGLPCILRIQYMIDGFFAFSVILKT